MGRIGSLVIVKGVELLLAVVLWETYDEAATLQGLLDIFVHQPELSQIGTITCMVIITTALAKGLAAISLWTAATISRAWSRITHLLGAAWRFER